MSIVSAIVAILLALPQSDNLQRCRAPELSQTSTELWTINVADVRSQSRSGFGLVVGWRPGEAWIAVPAHVIYGTGVAPHPDAIPTFRSGLQIRFDPKEAPRPLCAARAGLSNPTPPDLEADLAFVCVEWSMRPQFWSSLAAANADAKSAIVLLTRGELTSGSLADSVQTGGPAIVKATGMIGVAGMSGAPVAGASGVLGLYLGQDRAGQILSLAVVRRLAEAAQVPWELTEHEFYDCRRTSRVCPVSDKGLAPDAIVLRNPEGVSHRASVGACLDVPEGKYEVIGSDSGLACEPRIFSVTRQAGQLNLSLRCSPDLMGTWRTAEGHLLTCVVSIVGTAQCNGLGGLGLGLLQAKVRVEGSRLRLSGEFFGPNGSRAATGTLEWQGDRLRAEIQAEGSAPRSIELRREPQQ